ncbi:MAG: hypothetical protein HXS48_26310 [Theionarchaea archaeon]|nr:hypothetical protein [Theionarchaea archaeon]
MKLPEEDATLFYRLYHPLLYYVNAKYDLIDMETPEEIKEAFLGELEDLRDELYEHPEIIQEFIEENPFDFSRDELDIVREWNHFVKGKFIIFRFLKKYTIFLDIEDPTKAYGVFGLYKTFKELVGPLPVIVETVLLPFKEKIVYDGIVNFFRIHIGGGYSRGLNDDYQKAKFKFGIIESLPSSEKGEKSDEETLRFYLKSERNRDRYWEEIWELIDKNPKLLTLYHREMGKAHARTLRKELRKIGITKGWFAILEGVSIASGVTKGEAEKGVESIVPEEKWKFVYYFQLK